MAIGESDSEVVLAKESLREKQRSFNVVGLIFVVPLVQGMTADTDSHPPALWAPKYE